MTAFILCDGENDPINGTYEKILGVAVNKEALFNQVKKICVEDDSDWLEPDYEMLHDGMKKYSWNHINLFAYEIPLWE